MLEAGLRIRPHSAVLLRHPNRGRDMQENLGAPAVKCPVCGSLNIVAVYPQHLGMPNAKQTLIAYRCSDGHLFLPPERSD
jgi:hypothetical protein